MVRKVNDTYITRSNYIYICRYIARAYVECISTNLTNSSRLAPTPAVSPAELGALWVLQAQVWAPAVRLRARSSHSKAAADGCWCSARLSYVLMKRRNREPDPHRIRAPGHIDVNPAGEYAILSGTYPVAFVAPAACAAAGDIAVYAASTAAPPSEAVADVAAAHIAAVALHSSDWPCSTDCHRSKGSIWRPPGRRDAARPHWAKRNGQLFIA